MDMFSMFMILVALLLISFVLIYIQKNQENKKHFYIFLSIFFFFLVLKSFDYYHAVGVYDIYKEYSLLFIYGFIIYILIAFNLFFYIYDYLNTLKETSLEKIGRYIALSLDILFTFLIIIFLNSEVNGKLYKIIYEKSTKAEKQILASYLKENGELKYKDLYKIKKEAKFKENKKISKEYKEKILKINCKKEIR